MVSDIHTTSGNNNFIFAAKEIKTNMSMCDRLLIVPYKLQTIDIDVITGIYWLYKNKGFLQLLWTSANQNRKNNRENRTVLESHSLKTSPRFMPYRHREGVEV